jgi:hypothetical protein
VALSAQLFHFPISNLTTAMMFKLLLCATVATAFDVNDAFRNPTWCGPNDGMITSQSDCEQAAAQFGINFNGPAGSEWNAGCILHGGNAYYSPLITGASHHQQVDGGHLCAAASINWIAHKQNNQCTVNAPDSAGMMSDQAACEAAATGFGLNFNGLAGPEWVAGCVIHNGGAYFVPNIAGSHHQQVSGGFLCPNAVTTDAVCAESDCTCTAACESSCTCNKILTTTTAGWLGGDACGTGNLVTISNTTACPSPAPPQEPDLNTAVCSVTCTVDPVNGILSVVHNTDSGHSGHKCYKDLASSQCTCECL